MKLQLTAAFAALTVAAFANGASAAEPVVAKLAAAGSAQKPVAGGAVFDCLGDVCAARSPSSDTATVRTTPSRPPQLPPATAPARMNGTVPKTQTTPGSRAFFLFQ